MTLLEGVGYLAVASLLATRPVGEEMRVGARLFQGWWAGIGTNKVLAAAAGFGATIGVVSGPLYIAVLYLNLVILAASFWCLLAYFSFLYSGHTRRFGALAALCAVYLVLLTFNLTASRPIGVGFGEWRTYHTMLNPSPQWRNFLLLCFLVVLPAAPALAHLNLLRRLDDRRQKYRVALVSVGILLWTVSVLFVAFPGFDASPTRQVLSRLAGVLGALLALWAYRPPSWMRERLGIALTAGARA